MSGIDQDALQKAVAEEIKRLTSTGALQLPSGNAIPDRAKAGNYEFDPSTRRVLDPSIRRHLWRRDAIRSCPCGSVKWAHVQEFRGERELRTAMRPVVDVRSGRAVQMAFEHAYAQYDAQGRAVLSSCLISEELQMTPEKAAHLKECKGKLHQSIEDLRAGDEPGDMLGNVDEEQALKVVRMVGRGA